MPAPFSDTSKGYPYIAGTQNASLIDDWALQLATKLENTVPMAIAAGSVNVTMTASTIGSATVTFPVGRFTVAPLVFTVIQQAGQTIVSSPSGVTAAGFTANITDTRPTARTGTFPVYWFAVQMLPNAAGG